MKYQRKDFTGFTLKLFSYTVEVVFLKGFPITIAIDKSGMKTKRLFDIGHLFFERME